MEDFELEMIDESEPVHPSMTREASEARQRVIERGKAPKQWVRKGKMLNDNKLKDLEELSDIELRVACILNMKPVDGSYGYGNFYYGHDWILEGEGNIADISDEVGGRKGLSKVLKSLKTKGIVKYARGLMNEDNEVVGSGHAPDPHYREELQHICDEKGWL
jgi:hypothetical protein